MVKYWTTDSEAPYTSLYDAGSTNATISNLISSTNYYFQVAAVNSAGSGVFSESISAETGVRYQAKSL